MIFSTEPVVQLLVLGVYLSPEKGQILGSLDLYSSIERADS